MSVEIKLVTSRRDRNHFIEMPWNIYRNDPHWVPPLKFEQREFLDPRRGVFFQHGDAQLFLAFRDGKAVGRISAQINRRHDTIYKDGRGFFGFFECENEQETANALFHAAEQYLRGQGRRSVEGPFNFGIYDEIAVLVEGFDSDPYVLNVHNPPYYQTLLDQAGYRKAVDWYAFRGKRGVIDQAVSERLKKVRDRIVRSNNLTIRNMEMAHFDRDSSMVKEIFNDAWSQNWGHVPMSDAEFRRIAIALKQLIITELSYIVEVDGKPVGFILSIYDANEVVKQMNGRLLPFGFIKLLRNLKKVKGFRVFVMGVLDAHRNRGYEFAMVMNVLERSIQMHFQEAEMSLIVETNEPMLKTMERLAVERYKTYRIFHKDLA